MPAVDVNPKSSHKGAKIGKYGAEVKLFVGYPDEIGLFVGLVPKVI